MSLDRYFQNSSHLDQSYESSSDSCWKVVQNLKITRIQKRIPDGALDRRRGLNHLLSWELSFHPTSCSVFLRLVHQKGHCQFRPATTKPTDFRRIFQIFIFSACSIVASTSFWRLCSATTSSSSWTFIDWNWISCFFQTKISICLAFYFLTSNFCKSCFSSTLTRSHRYNLQTQWKWFLGTNGFAWCRCLRSFYLVLLSLDFNLNFS